VNADTPIIGGPQVAKVRLLAPLARRNTPNCVAIVDTYTVLGALTGVGNLLPFCQAAHETGWFTSAGWREGFNPAGLGATNDGAWGGRFPTPHAGIFAQYAHLLAYALAPNAGTVVQQACITADPRLDAMTKAGYRGAAPLWSGPNGRWAYPGATYAQAIMEIAGQL
jgi:N-acetylmuramoyl-L-alanine amidase